MPRVTLPRLVLAATALALLAVPSAAQAVQRPIVYAIVLDGLDTSRLTLAPNLSALTAGQGARTTYYRESRSVMIAETNPNHTAMVTGAYGNASGIPGNAFAIYAPLENEDSCVATGPIDESKPPSATSGEHPSCPQAQTVFEAVKRQGNPDKLFTAAIFGKPKLGRIFAGKRFDNRARDTDYLWAPCASGGDDDEYCGTVPTNPATGYAVDDKTVMDQVLRTLDGSATPRRPDFTFVNLHQIDSAGHASGTDSGPYDVAIRQADTEIGRLVARLRERGEWERTVMVLLSDHGMETTLQKTTLSRSFTLAGISSSDYLPVQNGSVDSIYLKNRTAAGRFALLKRMRAAAVAAPGVMEALYREPNPEDGGTANTIDGVHPGWHAAGTRSPDLLVVHRSGGAFSDPDETSNPIPGNHGGPQTRNNFFAVLSGGDIVRQQQVTGAQGPFFDDTLQNPGQSENVDVAPTVMRLLGLEDPANSRGRFLREAFNLDRVPGGLAPATKARLSLKPVRARRCSSRVRYRLRWAPRGRRFDVQVRGRGRYRSLKKGTRATTMSYVTRRGRAYRFRVRVVTSDGRRGAFTSRRAAPRRFACAARSVRGAPAFAGRFR